MIARLSRILPLIIILALIAAVVYLVAMYRYSPNRAKEILLAVFTWLTGILSGFFLLLSLYSWFEHNEVMLDLAGSFFITAVVALIGVRICHGVFIRHHPSYKKKPVRAKRMGEKPGGPFRPPWSR